METKNRYKNFCLFVLLVLFSLFVLLQSQTQEVNVPNHLIFKNQEHQEHQEKEKYMNPEQLKRAIETIIKEMDMYSIAATDLLMLTAAQETHCGKYIYQLGNGPARGIFQMEPETEQDIWAYLIRKGGDFQDRTITMYQTLSEKRHDLTFNIAYQIAMARLHYWRVPKSIPKREEFAFEEDYTMALALYWKEHWNTWKGAGTATQATNNYLRYVVKG